MQCSNMILMHLEKEYFLCTAQNTVPCNHTFLHILLPVFPGFIHLLMFMCNSFVYFKCVCFLI